MMPALCLGLALAAAATPQKRHKATVLYATQQRLYLDAGVRDGLAAGQVLQLHRAGKPAGSCKVESAGEKGATCAGSGAAGESFDLSPPPLAPAAQVQRLAPPDPAPVIEARKAVVTSAHFDKIDFHGGPGFGGLGTKADVTISHATWAATGVGPWHQERADVSLRDARLGGGFTLDLDMSARRWSLRSDPISFRPDDPTQLYVWEAAISRTPRENGFAVSLGRVRPRFAPGQVILDGAQAGFRSGSSEAGLFGGVVPDDVTLSPSLQNGTFGAYWAGQHAGDADSALRLLRHEARVAFVSTASLGKRVEGEGLIQLFLTKRFDGSANIRVGAGGLGSASGAKSSLDALRIDGNFEPVDRLSFTGGFRYDGLSIPELDGPANVRYGGAARHADLSAQWEPVAVLRISAISGLATDLTSGLTRRWLGPELGAPRLFGGSTAVSVGYLEEQGWASGRSGYLQLSARLRSRAQLVTRLSWFHSGSGLSPLETNELGIFASLRAQLSQQISVRLAAAGRSALNGGTFVLGGPATQTVFLDAALSGEF